MDLWYGFGSKRLSADYILCIRYAPKKKLEHNKLAHQLFVGFKKVNDSVRREFCVLL